MNDLALTPFLPAFWRLNRRRVLFWVPFLSVVAGYFALGPRGDAFYVFVPALLLGGYALLHHSYDQTRNARALQRCIAGTEPRKGQWTAICGRLEALDPDNADWGPEILAFTHAAHRTGRTFGKVGGINRDQRRLMFIGRYQAPMGIGTSYGPIRIMAFPDLSDVEPSDLPPEIARAIEEQGIWAPRFPPRSILRERILGRRSDRLSAYLRMEEDFEPGTTETTSRVLRAGDDICIFGIWRNGTLERSPRMTDGLPVLPGTAEQAMEKIGDLGRGLLMVAGFLLAVALVLAIWSLV